MQKLIKENMFDLILTDIRLEKSNGVDVLENVRELENVIERVVVLETGESIQNSSLPEEIFWHDTPNKSPQY